MKIGICTSVENIKKIEHMGYDYIEPTVVEIAEMTEENFIKVEQLILTSAIRCETFNVLFPKDIKLTGTTVDNDKMTEYLKKSFSRICRLGAEIVALGSGDARRVAEGIDRGIAFQQLVQSTRLIGDVAALYNLTIAVEPINTRETNIINTLADGLQFVLTVDHPHIKLMADFYHMRMENEDMQVLMTTGDYLGHTHIANSNGRIYPEVLSEDSYIDFFSSLKNAGYNNRMSVETSTQDIDRYGLATLKLLRSLSL